MTRMEVARIKAKHFRGANRAAGRCINGPRVGIVGARGIEHGPVIAGGKCRHCLDVAYGKRSAA